MKYLLEIFLSFLLSFHLISDDRADFDKLKETADSGDSNAQYELALLYYEGKGVSKDYGKASEWFKKAADQGDAKSQCRLGYCYREGSGVEKNESKAFECFNKAARQDDPNAQANLGYCYQKGIGVAMDARKAVEWYEKAAKSGQSTAQYNLAFCYEAGEGVERNTRKAFELYHKAAEQGNSKAQYNLGFRYQKGKGVGKDETKAVEWFKKAADQGDSNSQSALALCYGKGKGVAVDRIKAFEWFGKAADQKDEIASIQMACYYFGSAGFEVNSTKAMSYLEAAAEKRSSAAQLFCSSAYFNGYCMLFDVCNDSTVMGIVPADLDKSIKYAKMGIGSNKKGIKYLSAFILISGQLKKGDLKEALRTVKEFPAILFIAVIGYIALAVGFILLVAILFWIYSKSKMGRGNGGPWCLFDFFSLIVMLLPLAMVTQVLLLLPLHLLTSGVVQTVLLFGFGVVFFAVVVRMRGSSFKDAFALKSASARTFFLWALIFFIGVYALESVYLWGCGLLGIKLKPQLIAELLASKTLFGFQLGFVFMMGSLVIPVVEELIFRGILYQSLKTMMRPWIAIAISSAIFAAMHMSLSFFIILFAMGAIFAYSLERTKSIYVPIFLHCVNNTIVFAIAMCMR